MRRWRWFSLCGLAIGLGLLTGCTAAGMDRTNTDGTHTRLWLNSLNGESLATLGGMAGDAVQKYLPWVAGGGVLSVLGIGKGAAVMASRKAHRERDARDATWDEARRTA